MGFYSQLLVGAGTHESTVGDWEFVEGDVFRVTVSLLISAPPFNGQLNTMELPTHYMRAGQFCLWNGDDVVQQGFLQFQNQDLGIFAKGLGATQTINIWPIYYCLDQLNPDEEPPWCGDNWHSRKAGGEQWAISKRAKIEAEHPSATEEDIQTMMNCDQHVFVMDVRPAKMGWMQIVNRITLENFSDGVNSVVFVSDI